MSPTVLMSLKFVHIGSIFLVLLCLGAIASHQIQGGTKENFKNRKFFMALHGIALLVAIIAGMGLVGGRYSFANGWVLTKLGVWFVLGAYPVIFFKQKSGSKGPLLGLYALVLLALFAVEFKPF